MSIYNYLCLLFALVSIQTVQAQSKYKEFVYKYNRSGDSVITLQKERHFNQDSALIYKKHYFYDGNFQQNALWREENAVFFDNVLTQSNIFYRKNAEPVTERLESKYIIYTAFDSLDKIAWMKKYDTNNELVREDSFVFNKKIQAIEKWSYTYTGSTSVLLEKYKYNTKGNLKKTKFYIVWNTVNIRGKATAKKTLRGTYKYKYNKQNKLVSGKGKQRNTAYAQTLNYDKAGNLKEEIITYKYEEKYLDDNKQSQIRKVVDSTKHIYENGLLVEEYEQQRNVLKSRTLNTYEHGILVETKLLNADNQASEITKYTVKNNQYATGVIERYDSKGKLLFTTELKYNDKGLLIEEKLLGLSSNTIVGIKHYTYDIHNRVVDILHINGKEEKTERIIYEYF